VHYGYVEPQQRSHAESLLAMSGVIGEEVGVRSGNKVLDAGCGVGGTSVWLATERDVSVVGINIVPSQLRRAARRARQFGVTASTAFLEADLTDSGHDPDSFDIAWLQESSCHIPDKAGMLAEMRRVLRPGGRLAVADFFAEPRAAERDDFRTWVESWEMALSTEKEWRGIVASAGFERVHLRDVTGPMTLSMKRLNRRASLLARPMRFLERISARNETQIRNARGGRAMWTALQSGAFRYCVLTATLG